MYFFINVLLKWSIVTTTQRRT